MTNLVFVTQLVFNIAFFVLFAVFVPYAVRALGLSAAAVGVVLGAYGAGLMVKSFLRLQEVKPGFNPDRVLAVEVYLPRTTYKEGEQATAFYQQLLSRVQNLPGVEDAAAIDTLPLSGGGNVRARPAPAAAAAR